MIRILTVALFLAVLPTLTMAGPYECKQECSAKANQCIKTCWAKYVPGYDYPMYDHNKPEQADKGTQCVFACSEQGDKCRSACTDAK